MMNLVFLVYLFYCKKQICHNKCGDTLLTEKKNKVISKDPFSFQWLMRCVQNTHTRTTFEAP